VTPLAIAHRGDPFAFRENTLEAFAAAASQGADMVEIDVRRTADGAVVVVHDPTFERLWGLDGLVSATQLAEVRALGDGDCRVPELREVLAAISTPLMVDYTDADVAEPALEEIVRAGALDRVLFAGGNLAGHRRVRALAPEARIALTWTSHERCPDDLLDELAVEFFNPSGELLEHDPGLVALMHRRGTAVSTWTLDRRADMELALDLGVDAVITNRIGDLVALLSERQNGRAAQAC
jgi:glycerophosphoryl diester phosphodiesterase